MSSCFTSSFPRPSPNYKRRSATLPGILNFFGSSCQWEGFQSSLPGMGSLLTPYLTSSGIVFRWASFFKSAQGADTTNWTLLLSCALFSKSDVTLSVMLSFFSRHHKDHNSHEEHTSYSPAALGNAVPLTLIRPSSERSHCVFICGFFLHCAAKILAF